MEPSLDAPPLPSLPPPPPRRPRSPLPLYTSTELYKASSTPLRLLKLLIRHKLILPLKRPCPCCNTPLSPHPDSTYTDGYRLRCNHCSNDYSVRHSSIFSTFRTSLYTLAQIILHFHANLTIEQVHQLTDVSCHTISKFYKLIREKLQQYLHDHPIQYSPTQIIEIDELYVKALKDSSIHEEEKKVWSPIIGMIARDTGTVALEITPTHSSRDVAAATSPHLPSPTTIITDDHKSFIQFDTTHTHHTAEKIRRGTASWPAVRYEQSRTGEKIEVHTNTIESYWSTFRTHLHKSKGWPAKYLPLVLCECMFKSLHLPLSVALAAV